MLHHSHAVKTQQQLLDKHAKIFGIALIPRKEVLHKKRCYFGEKKNEFIKRMIRFDETIENLKNDIEALYNRMTFEMNNEKQLIEGAHI